MTVETMIEQLERNFSDEEIEMLRNHYASLAVQKQELQTTDDVETVVLISDETDSEKEISDTTEESADVIPTEPPVRENFLIRMARKSYDKKSAKAQARIKSVETRINNSEQEKIRLEKALSDLNEKCQTVGGEIVGLINANIFLEANATGGIIGKILKLTVNSNNKKIGKLILLSH